MKRCIPALPVQNIPASIVFYQSKPGLSAPHYDSSFARLIRDEAEIHIWAANDDVWKFKKQLPLILCAVAPKIF